MLIGYISVRYGASLARLCGGGGPDPAARERANRVAGVPVYEEPAELLRRTDIAAVVICTPTHLHAPLAIAAASAGKHFYLEKPIATTAAEARDIIEAAGQAGVTGAIGFNRRLHPLYQQARDLLAGGRIGRVRAVQTTCCEPMPLETMPSWRQQRVTGGGCCSSWLPITLTCFAGRSVTKSPGSGHRSDPS